MKRSAAKALAALPMADRLREGHYRVVYEWQRSALVILVVRIGHHRAVSRGAALNSSR